MSEQVKQLVESKIKSKKVVVFSKSRCPFCTNAKKVLSTYELSPKDYEVMEIENDPNCLEIQAYLKEITGTSSVPRVFINGQCIGGSDDTVRLHKTGELSKLLA